MSRFRRRGGSPDQQAGLSLIETEIAIKWPAAMTMTRNNVTHPVMIYGRMSQKFLVIKDVIVVP